MTQEEKEKVIQIATLYIKCLAIQRFLKEHDSDKQPENIRLKLATHILVDRGTKFVDELEKELKDYLALFNSEEAQKISNEFSTKETIEKITKEALTVTMEEEIKAFVTMTMKANGD